MPVQPRTPPGTLELCAAADRVPAHAGYDPRGFERFGFLPVETPVFELTDVLLTKSGGETEKQVYFVQSTARSRPASARDGAALRSHRAARALTSRSTRRSSRSRSRRYQIQRVYRGERAQKGATRVLPVRHHVIGKDTLSLAFDAEAARGDPRRVRRARRVRPRRRDDQDQQPPLAPRVCWRRGGRLRAARRGPARGRSPRKMERAEVAQRIAAIPTSTRPIRARPRGARAAASTGSTTRHRERDFTRGLADYARPRDRARARRARVEVGSRHPLRDLGALPSCRRRIDLVQTAPAAPEATPRPPATRGAKRRLLILIVAAPRSTRRARRTPAVDHREAAGVEREHSVVLAESLDVSPLVELAVAPLLRALAAIHPDLIGRNGNASCARAAD